MKIRPNMRHAVMFLAFSTLIAVAVAAPARAAGLVPEECQAGRVVNECTICHIGILVINITNFLIKNVAFPVTAALILAGGIMLLIAGSSEERLKMGKQILKNTIVGLIIVLLSWLIVDTLIKVLTGVRQLSSLGPWNTITIDATNCTIK